MILVTSIINGCAGIPSGKVNLRNYPEINGDVFEKIDLGIIPIKPEMVEVKNKVYVSGCKDGKCFSETRINSRLVQTEDSVFTQKLEDNFRKKISQNTRLKDNKLLACRAVITGDVSYNYAPLCFLHQYISAFTLTIIPYYCQTVYQANASLISYPKESQIHGTIKTSIREAKIGDIFLDENDHPAKLLKTYELKDKVHEFWSSLFALAAVPITSLRKTPTPYAAKAQVENTISEALVRQVLHDANTFEECQKTSPSNIK